MGGRGIAGVVFDMDGVLVESERAWHDIHKGVLADYGYELDDASYRELYGASDEVENVVLGRIMGVSPEVAGRRKREYVMRNPIDYAAIVMPGAPEALNNLKTRGLRLALASSSLAPDVNAMLDQTGLRDRFDAVVTGSDCERAKPDPAIYLEACARLGARPVDLLAVDDSAYGVEAAARAGMRVVHFARDEAGAPHDPSAVELTCSDFAELESEIEALLG